MTDSPLPPDTELVTALQAGNDVMLRAVYDHYHPQVYAFVARQFTDKAQAEEIAHDIFLGFLESLRDFRFQSSVKTFLFTIARYKVIDEIRKKKIKHVMLSHMPEHIVDALHHVTMDPALQQSEMREMIEQVLKRLPTDYARVLTLKYVDGHPVSHIASLIALPFKATESLLWRARKAFRMMYQAVAT